MPASPSRPPSRSRVWALLLALLIPFPRTHAAEREIYAVVVSPDVAVSDVSLDDLKRIFRFSKRYWKAGETVSILYTEAALDSGSFMLEQIYQKTYPELRRMILQRLYQGEMSLAPKVVATDGTAIEFVSSGKGLVALVAANSVKDGSVKILSIGGKLPGDEGYPLQR